MKFKVEKNKKIMYDRGTIKGGACEMMPSIGSLLIIAVIALLIFGPKKLPEIGKAFGSSLKEFKDATKGLHKDDDAKPTETKKELE